MQCSIGIQNQVWSFMIVNAVCQNVKLKTNEPLDVGEANNHKVELKVEIQVGNGWVDSFHWILCLADLIFCL